MTMSFILASASSFSSLEVCKLSITPPTLETSLAAPPDDKFVNIIKLFKPRRIDGNQKYLDLLCESFLTESELKSFDYSDTMARFKTTELLEKRGIKKVKMFLWKRDIYPVYE